MRYGFGDKVVVITGAGSGIGRELALALAEEGARLALVGRRLEALERTAESISGLGLVPAPECLVAVADVTDPAACEAARAAIASRFGRVDVLVNNAGASMRGEFAGSEPRVLRSMVEANLLGPMLATRAFLPALAESGGTVCFVSSLAGLFGLPEVSAYSAAKMGLTALAQSLRTEYAGTGVGFVVAHIGLVDNDPGKRVLAADGSMIPLSRPSHATRKAAARFIAEAIRRRRRVAVHTPAGLAMAAAARFAPGLVAAVAGFARRRLRRFFG